jgi:hypothetical protein
VYAPSECVKRCTEAAKTTVEEKVRDVVVAEERRVNIQWGIHKGWTNIPLEL